MLILPKVFQKLKEGTLSNLFCEANITPIPNLDKRPISFMNIAEKSSTKY